MLRALKRLLDKRAASRVRALEKRVDWLAAFVAESLPAREGLAFNGQEGRRRLFSDLLAAVAFDRIIETGARLGDTTAHLARVSGLPVHTCELDRMLFRMARVRLKPLAGVSLLRSDSRAFLAGLGRRPEVTGGLCFFYLDAHGGDDCPLLQEVRLIASRWGRFVVMIDDFRVPGDEGYGFDSYGAGRKRIVFELDLLAEVVEKHRLRAFFPALPSAEETGTTPRGCVVLAPEGALADALGQLSGLTPPRRPRRG